MNSRSMLIFPLISCLAAMSGQALAFGEAFQQARFDNLNKAGAAVLVHIHASWCSTCRTQDKRLSALFQSPENKAIVALEVNFDQQKDAVRAFQARYQSVLIGFKGGKEVDRLVGETRESAIADLLDRLR
jgi:thioredoxin 1